MTPEQLQELERSTSLYQTTLVALGAQTVADSLSLWADVPPLPDNATSQATAKWLAAAVAYVMHRRLRARDLALAYYRYQRALATGKTIGLPGQENPPYISLPELKRQFEATLHPDLQTPAEASQEPGGDNPPQDGSQPDTGQGAGDQTPSEPSDTDQIEVEELPGLQEALDSIEEQAEQAVRSNLQTLGPSNLDNKIKHLPNSAADQSDKDRQQAHKDAGNRQAASAARNVMNGARGPLFAVGSTDGKVLGFVRASKTGTPCGWCAMLISRGFIPKSAVGSSFYKSSQGSGEQADGSIVTFGDLDLYHDNCQCYAVPIYSMAQLKGAQFALNREYAALWPRITAGLGGKAALTVWRRHFRNQARSRKSQGAAA